MFACLKYISYDQLSVLIYVDKDGMFVCNDGRAVCNKAILDSTFFRINFLSKMTK